MIPLRDSTRSRSFPFITITLIILNIFIFVRQSMMDNTELGYFFLNYSFIPALLTERLQLFFWAGLLYPPLLTATFLHGNWFHLLFNMLYLWIFGDNIEDRLGHFRFLFFYLLCGILANGVHYLTNVYSPIPLVGASGAIAGVLGAYFLTYPRARITSIVYVFFFFTIRDIPAVFFLFFWFVTNLIQGLFSPTIGGGTAWWAHIGGFVFGMLLMTMFNRRRPRNPTIV